MRKVFRGFLVLSVLLWLIAALPSTAMARNHKHRGARPHLALAAHNDDDEDGEPACGEEPDDADQLAAVRAMAAEQCDCDSASNHDGYVSCVDEVADAAVEAGLLRDACEEVAEHCAKPSADEALIRGATAMAWTCVDAATNGDVRSRLLAGERKAGAGA